MQLKEVLVLDITDERSSLVKRLEYNVDEKELTVFFRKEYPSKYPLTYIGVEEKYFKLMCEYYSIGKFYLQYIKPNFKLKTEHFMADAKKKVPTKNLASDEVRWIELSIDVKEIVKAWLFEGEKGTYLKMKLRMLPDGEVDKHGNLGMIVQVVPQRISKDEYERKVPKAQRTQGPILGNAREVDWDAYKSGSSDQYAEAETDLNSEVADDLPF